MRLEMNETTLEDLALRLRTLSVGVEEIGASLHRIDRSLWPTAAADNAQQQIRTMLDLSEQIDRTANALLTGIQRRRAVENDFAAESDVLGSRFVDIARDLQALNTRFASRMDRSSRLTWQRSAKVESMFVPTAGQSCLVPALELPIRKVVDWSGEGLL